MSYARNIIFIWLRHNLIRSKTLHVKVINESLVFSESWYLSQYFKFYGRESAFCTQPSENLTLANTLTVLQTYRQAFSFPQLTLNWLVCTGFFSLKLNTGFFALKLWATLDNLKVKNPVIKLRAKIPELKSNNFKSYLTWPGFELKPV